MNNRAGNHASSSTPASSLRSLVQLVLACTFVGVVFYFGSRQIDLQPSKPPPAPEVPPVVKPTVPEKPYFDLKIVPRDSLVDAGKADSKESEPEPKSPTGAQRARLIAARAKMEQAMQRVQQLQAELVRWRTGYEPLATNDAGQRLASDPAALGLAESVWSHTRPDENEVVAWRDELAALQDDLNAKVQDSDAMTRVTAIADAVRTAAVSFETDRLVLETLIDKTKSQAPGSKTFQEALDERRTAAVVARAEALRQAAEAAHDQQTETLKQLEADLTAKTDEVQNLTIQNAKRRLDNKLLLLAEEGKADVQAAQRARERLQLVKNFERDQPQVKQYLIPFLADGFKHRENAGGTKGPASYNKLVAQGALEPTRQGMESLILMATRDNDRPHGPFPVLLLGDYGWSQYPKGPVEKTQALLTKYGSLMAELKLLAE